MRLFEITSVPFTIDVGCNVVLLAAGASEGYQQDSNKYPQPSGADLNGPESVQ